MRHVRTCCLACKEPARLIREFIIFRVRTREYRCPICNSTIVRKYDLKHARPARDIIWRDVNGRRALPTVIDYPRARDGDHDRMNQIMYDYACGYQD